MHTVACMWRCPRATCPTDIPPKMQCREGTFIPARQHQADCITHECSGVTSVAAQRLQDCQSSALVVASGSAPASCIIMSTVYHTHSPPSTLNEMLALRQPSVSWSMTVKWMLFVVQ